MNSTLLDSSIVEHKWTDIGKNIFDHKLSRIHCNQVNQACCNFSRDLVVSEDLVHMWQHSRSRALQF